MFQRLKKIADKSEPFTLRIDAEWLNRIDALIEQMTRPGYIPTQTAIMRMAIAQGLDSLEREQSAFSARLDRRPVQLAEETTVTRPSSPAPSRKKR